METTLNLCLVMLVGIYIIFGPILCMIIYKVFFEDEMNNDKKK